MALSNHDEARIREYLLGHLSEEEQEKIEERLMVDDDLFEELEISKGELIEEYCAGELDEKEHQWFGGHYLATPEGKRRYTFTSALSCLEPPGPSPGPSPTLLGRIVSLFTVRRWATAGPVALLLLIGASALLYRSTPPAYLAVELTSNFASRSPANKQYQKISLRPAIGEVRISLKLPESATPRSSYRVVLDDQINTTTVTPTSHDANSVSVVIPAKQLPPGLYSLSLYGSQADRKEQREPWEYYFEITN
jgi:hypothetical protein